MHKTEKCGKFNAKDAGGRNPPKKVNEKVNKKVNERKGGKNMARIWTDGPHVHEGETCPVCHEENLHFRQYQELDDGTVEEVYFCYYCDDYIRFYP